MKIKTFALITACLCQHLHADPAADKEKEIQRMQEKESLRARETADSLSDRETFEKRYGWLKNDNASLFAQAFEKQQLAAKAWRTAADGMSRATGNDQINALKIPAYDADAAAEIARLELKAAASEKDWKRSAEKYKSKNVESLSAQLMQNQKTLIQTTKQHMASQKLLRQLEVERIQLDKKMRDACDNARRAEQEERDKKNKNSSKDREKKPPTNNDKERHDIKPPPNVIVE